MSEGKLQWHPAFSAALHIELEEELGVLYIEDEHLLSRKPMQLLVTKELSREENYWLQSLRDDLKTGEEIQRLVQRYEDKKYEAYYSEVMNLIVRANWEKMKEEKEMCEALRELFAEELRESEERGIELTKKIYRLSKGNVPVKRIAVECGITEKRVREILE